MFTNFKLTIEYDGTDFHGWQRQSTERTVQAEIEKAIATITGQKTPLIGSGRTDAGVHALAQTANFRSGTRLGPDALGRALNSMMPPDIVIKACIQVPPEFHARFDVVSKSYHYRILNRPLPPAVGRQYAWNVRRPLDIAAMRTALTHIRGTHDFKAFEASGSPRAHTVRHILQAELAAAPDGHLTVILTGNGFLRFMVRNIVGTLVDVGLGKTNTDGFKAILQSRDRTRAGVTAPPRGLFLMMVEYSSPDKS